MIIACAQSLSLSPLLFISVVSFNLSQFISGFDIRHEAGWQEHQIHVPLVVLLEELERFFPCKHQLKNSGEDFLLA